MIGYGNWSRTTQMKHIMPAMNKGLRKLIHKKYDTINECILLKNVVIALEIWNITEINNWKKEFRLLVCSNCVSCENKKIVFRSRDANSAINIMKLTKLWIEKQEQPCEFQKLNSSLIISDKKKWKKLDHRRCIPAIDFTFLLIFYASSGRFKFLKV